VQSGEVQEPVRLTLYFGVQPSKDIAVFFTAHVIIEYVSVAGIFCQAIKLSIYNFSWSLFGRSGT
jgi:hypothetical protein